MSLALKRKEAELKNVEAARASLEVREMEMQEGMTRVRDQIKIQLATEEKIKAEIEKLKEQETKKEEK